MEELVFPGSSFALFQLSFHNNLQAPAKGPHISNFGNFKRHLFGNHER